MTLREQLKLDAAKFKELRGKDRIDFIRDYYGIPIVITIVVIVVAVLGIRRWAEEANYAMYAVLVNPASGYEQADKASLNQLLADAGVDMTDREISFVDAMRLGNMDNEADMQTMQVLAAMFSVEGLDFFAANEEVFARYAVLDAFVDLTHLIPEDLLQKHADGLYYSEDEEGVRMLSGILLTDSPLHKAGYYSEPVVVGVAATAQNMEEARLFLLQLLED